MGYREYLLVIVYLCVLNHLNSAPLSPQEPGFCKENTLLKFKNGNEYFYDYSTKTTLWINDVSDESKSNVELKAKVIVRSVSQCTYLLRIEDASISGATINAQAASNLADLLNSLPVQFRLNSDGEIDSVVDFSQNDQPWSRNIKRGILSSLQLKNPQDLRTAEPDSNEGRKSAVVYETDVLGRCRTTYSTDDDLRSSQIELTKKKSLQRCTLNGNSKTSAIQYKPYKSLPEFHQGRLFIEEYKCKSTVKAGIIDNVDCEEKSTYKVGSRGTKGVQAVVKQSLKYQTSTPGFNRMAVGPFESLEINFEYTDKTVDDLEYKNFDINRFLSEICSRANSKDGLDAEHSNNFRNLVNKIESYSEQQLLSLHSQAKGQCEIAGTTVLNALVFANTENSFQAVLKLFDRDEFATNLYITEYPLLTALARNPNPSMNFLKKLKDYIATKDSRFAYLKKLILVYSALIKAHCENNNDCEESTLNDLNSILLPNLGTDCTNGKKELAAVTLKAIGNIGHLSDPSILINCAKNQQNSAEVRVSAIQAFRRFSCDKLQNVNGLPELLRNKENDAELRINVFQALIRCSENEKYQEAAKNIIPKFLDEETDAQVLTYIIDYAKEHGITTLLNAILANPRLKEKFSVNFKELSWNNYKYRYSILRDGALEVDTSVIFDTKKAFLPRSIRFNTTVHMFGMSINFIDLTIRMEGLDEILKLAVINKLKGENLIKKFVESPETLIDVLQAIASKLQNKAEKPYFSVLARIYGADVFFSELDDPSELRKMAEFIRSPRDKLLYAKVQAVRNMFLIDSRVRQPLLNGFEFNTFMDSSLSLVITKDSTKQDSAGKRSYDINNFYSSSVSINKRFEIQLNSENKVALKKKVLLNTRLNLDLSGTKGNGSYSYNIALTPRQEIPLVVLDGRFYKLVSNKDYREITQFEDRPYTSDRCTSGNFLESVGVDLCVSVKRPSTGTLLSILSSDNDDSSIIDNDDQDDDGEDDDDQNDIKPRFILSGPYHYEIKLKNPDLLKALIINAEIKKDDQSTNIKGKLQAQRSNNQIQDKLDLVYLRKRSDTNLRIDRSITLDLNRANSQDSRFKFAAEFSYAKSKLIYLNFNLDNKIIKDFKTYLQFKRDKTNSDNVLPIYKLEAGLDSKVIDDKHRRLAINLIPDGKNIKGDLLIEYSGASSNYALVKVVDGRLNLRSRSDSKVDYDVDLVVETKRPSKLQLTGNVVFDLLSSNITLNADYSNENIRLSQPISINLGHSIDVSTPDSLSYITLSLKHPDRRIDYGLKTLFQASLSPMSLRYVEVQVRTPQNAGSDPYTVYAGKQVSNEGSAEVNTYLAGFKNFNLDLSQPAEVSGLAKALVNLDKEKDPVLRSLELKFSRKKDQEAKSRQSTITGQKNGKPFLSIQASRQGSLKSLRETPNEIPKQNLGAALNIKYKDYSGSVDAKLSLENSVSRGQHAYSLDFKTDGLIKVLLKIVSLSSKVQVDKNARKVTAEYELIKIGEVKSLKIKTTNNQLRDSGAAKEFDVSYEKLLASGKKSTSTGVVKYVFEDVKNFESSLDIPNFFGYKVSMSNERSSPDAAIGTHDFYLKYSNLDVQPDERELKLSISNTTENQFNKLKININAKKGGVGALNQLDQLAYLIDLKSDYTFVNTATNQRIIYNAENKVAIKFKKFNIDLKLDNTMKSDVKTSEFSGNVDLDVKFPAIVSDPGKLNFFKDNIKFTLNKATGKRTIKFAIDSDNKLIGKYFKSLEGDYSREKADNTNTILLNANLIDSQNNRKNINLKVDRKNCIDEENELCSNTKISLKQNIKPTYESRIARGTTLDITDCKWESKYERSNGDDEFIFNLQKELECNGVEIIDNEILIRRDKVAKELELKFEASSDVLYGKRAYKLKIKRFNKKDGKIEISLAKPDVIDFSHSISYRRELDETTGKLSKGTYKIETSFGPRTKKSCEMTIESKTNYYNKMSCSLKSPRLPVEVTFGFLLKSNNHKEWLFGKRDVTLEVNLPSTRQLRFNYVANRYTQVEAVDVNDKDHDDDDDLDNEREFNATLTYHWDFKRDQSKFIKINAKRENNEKGSVLTIDLNNYPKLDLLRIEVDRKRSFNQTEIGLAVSYQLRNGKRNRLDIDATLASDLDTNSGKLEINLERPKFNIQYTNKFNKYNGRLQFLQVRLGKLIQMTVDKFDPDDRKIYFELANPDESRFTTESSHSLKNHVHTVISNLKSSNRQLSKLESSFDSDNNNLNLNLNDEYKLNVGFYNESLATLILTETRSNKNLALASLRIVDIEGINNLEFELHWNRFWSAIQQSILKGQDQGNRADSDPRFNSYLGDVYSELVDDLKESYEAIREDRRQAREDIKQCLLLHVDFYSNFIPEKYRGALKAKLESIGKEYDSSNVKLEDLPLHKRIFHRYNRFANTVNRAFAFVKLRVSKRFAKYIPRLATIKYNNEASNPQFDNNVIVTRPVYYSRNLYQFNAEYREYLRLISLRILSIKGNLARNLKSFSIKALINKYKYRPMDSYTMVGQVYNRRNIIAFNGNSKLLRSKCTYLLAHELTKNRFTVILNNNQNNNQEPIITIHAYGLSPININAENAFINGRKIALPYRLVNNEKGVEINVRKENTGVSYELNNDLLVKCHQDSRSCSIATTRFFTGKLNGLLGKSSYDLENFEEDYWFLDRSCKAPTGALKKPSDEAIKTCYSIFGKQRKSIFKNAFQVVKPTGWQKLCEAVLSFDAKGKCALMKSFVQYARIKNIDVDEPNECYQCKVKDQSINVGQTPKNIQNPFEQTADYVFVFLPCDYRRNLVDLTNNIGRLQAKISSNRYYFVKVDDEGASVYQPETSQLNNFDVKRAIEQISEDKTVTDVPKEHIYQGLFLAGTLFSNRLADSRHLVIVSCGNCIPYSSLSTLKLYKLLSKRNIIVSAWGDYPIRDVEGSLSDDNVVGYGDENIYLSNKNTNQVESDSLDGYTIEHKGDLCNRLAIKTNGNVFDINQLKKARVFEGVLEKIKENKPKAKQTLQECERIETPFGDVADFSYERKDLD